MKIRNQNDIIDFKSDPLFNLSYDEMRRILENWIPLGIRFQGLSGISAFLAIAERDLTENSILPVNKYMLQQIVKFGFHASQTYIFQQEDLKILLKCLSFLSNNEIRLLATEIHDVWKE